MIAWLKIKNLALVQDAEIDFGKELNIISGETGAGKSVIISAISILFGARTDKNVIRTGETKCELSAGIKLRNNLLSKIEHHFKENSIEFNSSSELIIRRIITPYSSRSFINDTSVTSDTLNSISEHLLDFHGPQEHQSFLNTNNILYLIDSYGGSIEERIKIESLYSDYKNIEKELSDIEKDIPNDSETEYLRHMLSEISQADPKPNEDFDLYNRYKIASNSRSLIETANHAKNLLYDSENSAFAILGQTLKKLSEAEKIDEENVSKFSESLNNISSLLKDLSYDIDDYASRIELDEAAYFELENRLGIVSSLKKKYGPSLENVLLNKEKAEKKLELADNFSFVRERLNQSLLQKKNEFIKAAKILSEKRKIAGVRFADETVKKLKTLGFSEAALSILFTETDPSSSGIDKLELLFSANKGEKAASLRSVASSGELSRIMLAVKTVLSHSELIPILIFDEIDANIGGEVANEVGKELRKLGKEHQVICISHLAQVASFAETHLCVIKEVKGERTFTSIRALSPEEKITEISRMLGGGKAASIHASEILKRQSAK
ncbi:MAG TPA: DNA repair protein RecN [Lentisphaeria bacterium]|nr:MAG: DNA repair protein RecN [Lentisphaerae bacterium GWF2_38_69]HBM15058.1 DNA repair protein RecN [Lentisphaeria bacterium]